MFGWCQWLFSKWFKAYTEIFILLPLQHSDLDVRSYPLIFVGYNFHVIDRKIFFTWSNICTANLILLRFPEFFKL